ncbi:hypothetical protein LWM68_21610 [Niabella sp. W65]|nr:hypothetical protein [Niabella sp. W65]MCH7365127.1 hypothetical protein [Niabella sp. W65]ULT40945.1 hypothetical protein KRR40_40535 [Niabella sp. I65]
MPKRMELMNGYEFVKYQAERDSANAANNYFTEGRTLEDYKNIAGTDLQDEMFKTSSFQNHFISLSGGNLTVPVMQYRGRFLTRTAL